ncbi:ribokinase [Cerasicoccus frondis]|uniref:ribokinase n=1 Tax=Cerasicoccus frondis TaxID=490090 RepID=UPI00285272FE|nr:ribokinase [Cerasicoccus frondis]
MPRVLNLGSINIDHVYTVDHFVRPGESEISKGYEVFAGGKGFNQSIALARAGAEVSHLGAVGEDGAWLVERLKQEGVDVGFVSLHTHATGHALIQVATSGENAIVVYPGANQEITHDEIQKAMASFGAGDWLLTQNETSGVAEAMQLAKEKGLRIAFNAAPMSEAVHGYPLELVDLFILNETEAEALAGVDKEPASDVLCKRYPQAAILLTLGAEGARYLDANCELTQAAEAVDVVDTTAAGDTFIGYFLGDLIAGKSISNALETSCRAAGIAVTRPGASNSIPLRSEFLGSTS